MEFAIVIVLAVAVAAIGIGIGLAVAPRIDRWQQEREGPDDDAG